MRCWFIPPLVLIAKAIARLPQPVFLGLGSVLAVLLRPLLASRRRIARITLSLTRFAAQKQRTRSLLSKRWDC